MTGRCNYKRDTQCDRPTCNEKCKHHPKYMAKFAELADPATIDWKAVRAEIAARRAAQNESTPEDKIAAQTYLNSRRA